MLDGSSPKHRLIASAMELAKARPWRNISLLEIATNASIPLAEARKDFQSKAQVLAAFSRAVDHAVLEKFPKLFRQGRESKMVHGQ